MLANTSRKLALSAVGRCVWGSDYSVVESLGSYLELDLRSRWWLSRTKAWGNKKEQLETLQAATGLRVEHMQSLGLGTDSILPFEKQ